MLCILVWLVMVSAVVGDAPCTDHAPALLGMALAV